jgi:Lar family restriction alleviation protein
MICFPPEPQPEVDLSEPLKPCPFCGSARHVAVKSMAPDAPEFYCVHCTRCLAYGPGRLSRNAAAHHWNVRCDIDRLRELLLQAREIHP